ncbi:electron transport complex subunit RsxC [Spirochaetia bacterium 38H-sp]|uniref:Ion-translocating oxidoreductase complex subunit C n=1 Tax=Rarispira pelagica TaxID=3141764 RepID=A0ABU9UD73_9SPIR
MSKITFPKGGIHPPENKITEHLPIETMPIPDEVAILLSQHLGAPAKPIVAKGDKVLVGTLIGEAQGFISANIHSSVSGTVVKIDEIPDANGYPKTAVVIKVEGDEWEPSCDLSSELKKECPLSPSDIIEKIKQAGIVGMGGAGFPTHVKLMIPEGKSVDTLIINAAECEPYLTADHRLLLERTEELLVGVSILKKALSVDRAVIGIESNKPDAIKKLSETALEYEGIEIKELKTKYPQGAEKQLIKAVTGREVPSGRLPLDVGCVVINAGTAHAVYRAVQKNIPLIERVVTVTGKALKKPANLMVRTGTPVSVVVDYAGGLPDDICKVISGGPMMGKAMPNLDSTITKTTSGILVITGKEAIRPEPTACIRCAKCVSVCPMGLEPYLLEKLTENKLWDKAEEKAITDCVECGSCSYICPAARPLLDNIRYGKSTVMMIKRKRSAK